MFNLQDPGMVESLSKNVTRQGMTSTTLNYLRVRMQWSLTSSCCSPMTTLMFKPFLLFQLCVILEPMQELMSRHKAYALNPRDCLKTTLFQKWQKMVAPPGKERQTVTELCNSADIGRLCMRPRYIERTTQVPPSGLKRCLQMDTTLKKEANYSYFILKSDITNSAVPDIYCNCLAVSIIHWVLYNVSLNVWV